MKVQYDSQSLVGDAANTYVLYICNGKTVQDPEAPRMSP